MRTILFLIIQMLCTVSLRATATLDSLPSLICPSSVTLSVGPFNCFAQHNYTVEATDDGPLLFQQTSGLASGDNFPTGLTLNQFVVTDTSGNTASCSFTVTVRDFTPPVMVCNQAVSVSLSVSDDPLDCYESNGIDRFGSVAWLPVSVFDNGTFDQCSNFRLTIQRMAPYSDFVGELNPVNGHPPCSDPFPDFPSEYERAILEQDSIKFYCGEVGTTQTVVLRAYQVDSQGNVEVNANGGLIFNECSIQVLVEDKVKPVCQPPAEVTTTCEGFDPSLLAYGTAQGVDNCCIDTVTFTANYNLFDTICSRGTITRTFRVYDAGGNSASCTQRVVVSYLQDYYIKFPNDVLATNCSADGLYGEPTFFGEDCELLDASYQDHAVDPAPGSCVIILRNWYVVNWCKYQPNLPFIDIPNPNPNALQNHPTNLPGPIVSACGTPAPWSPTITKISPIDTAATNYCSFWSANANGYHYTQSIKIQDQVLPQAVDCPVAPLVFSDTTENHPFYWNNVFDPALPAQNLSEVKESLSITVTDACSFGGNMAASYLLFLDLDGDGVQESVVNSQNPPPADTIFYNNAQSPNFIGGTAVSFDNRPVLPENKWRFALQRDVADSLTVSVRWNTPASPGTFVVPELPVGTHRIRWSFMDVCGNHGYCEHDFTVLPTTLVSSLDLEAPGFVLLQNEPNPFDGSTRIRFHLPETAAATFSVMDVGGRLLHRQVGDYTAGWHRILLNQSDLPASGVLFYQLESGAQVAWKKMVVLR